METSIWRALFYLVGIMAFAALNAAYLVWCERKGAARIQRRSGPTEVGYEGLLQPLADGLKLMSKQLLVPRGVDGVIFRLAPVLAMIPGITSMVVIPFSGNIQARAMELSLLLIFALASLGMIAILLGGWASGNKYAIISSARAVSQSLAYEIPMLITAMSLSQRLVPAALVTEGMSVAITGILIGISTGAAVGGWAIERWGPHEAYAVPVTAGAVAVALALGAYRRLATAEAEGGPQLAPMPAIPIMDQEV